MSTDILEPVDCRAGNNDSWSVAQAEKNGTPMLIRFRSERPEGVDIAAFPLLLSATWSYEPTEFGLPSPDAVAMMDAFEDALATSLEGTRTAYLMVVLTQGGQRDWLWYTSSEEEAMRRVNQALKGHQRYPVEFAVQPDRAWRAWTQFIAEDGSQRRCGETLIGWAIAKAMRIFGRL
jgi:hypothetical protein